MSDVTLPVLLAIYYLSQMMAAGDAGGEGEGAEEEAPQKYTPEIKVSVLLPYSMSTASASH